jgi:hypothetical protein
LLLKKMKMTSEINKNGEDLKKMGKNEDDLKKNKNEDNLKKMKTSEIIFF